MEAQGQVGTAASLVLIKGSEGKAPQPERARGKCTELRGQGWSPSHVTGASKLPFKCRMQK